MTRHRAVLAIAWMLAACLMMPRATRAQPLADRVPGDAVVYIGWGGASENRAAYDGSHLQAVLHAADFRGAWEQLRPQLIQKLAAEDKSAAEAVNAWLDILNDAARYPTAFFVRGEPNGGDVGGVKMRFGLICRAGSSAPELLQRVRSALAKTGQSLVRVEQAGDLVVLSSGYEKGETVAAADPAAALVSAEPFHAAATQTGAAGSGTSGAGDSAPSSTPVSGDSNPVAIAFVNAERGLDLIGHAIAAEGKDVSEVWARARDASGLKAAKSWMTTGRFSGKDWNVRTFLRTAGERTGILGALLDSKPVDRALLARVPRDATYVLQGSFDPAKLLAETRRTVAAADPKAGETVDKALGAAQLALGRNLQTEIFEPLGEQWVVYTAPDSGVGANNAIGLVVVNKLDDAAKAQRGLTSLTFALSNMGAQALRQRGVTATLKQQKLPATQPGGPEATMYYVDIAQQPMLSPAWVVQDGFLYIGPSKPAVLAAATFHGTGKTIADVSGLAQFKQLVHVPAKFGGIEFADLQRTVDGLYKEIDANSETWLRALRDRAGVQLDKLPVPPLEKLKQQLSPYLRLSWTDDAGYHSSTIEPFPLSGALAPQKMGSASVPAIAGVTGAVLVPSLLRARETANRVTCASHMRQIGVACLLYSNENRGKYPPDIATLLRTQDITWDVFVCPDTNTTLPIDQANTPDQIARWTAEHTDYVYTGASFTTATPANRIVLYEDMHHHGDGCNILFADGHVEYVLQDQARKWIAAGEKPLDDPTTR